MADVLADLLTRVVWLLCAAGGMTLLAVLVLGVIFARALWARWRGA